MSWAVEIIADSGNQRDGRIARYFLAEDLVAVEARVTGGSGEEEVARALIEKRRTGRR